jgi:hypothetical protein
LGAKGESPFAGSRNSIGLGIRGFVEVPTEKPQYNVPYPGFRNLAGTSGEVNYGGDVLFARTWWRSEFVANFGYKQTGNPERGLRLQFFDSSQTDPSKFLIGSPPSYLWCSAMNSASVQATASRCFITTKATGGLFQNSTTRTLWAITLQQKGWFIPRKYLREFSPMCPWYHAISMGAEWQLLLNDGGKGQSRSTAFQTPDGRGDVNFGELMNDAALTTAVETYLQSGGATFSEGSSKVLASNNPLFDSWRNITVAPGKIQSQGHTNVLVFVTWRFGGGRY